MAIFNKGDNVILQANGPRMKVEGHTEDGKAMCQWLNKQGELKHGVFSEETLVKVEESDDNPIYTG